jgi:hypothetical protein
MCARVCVCVCVCVCACARAPFKMKIIEIVLYIFTSASIITLRTPITKVFVAIRLKYQYLPLIFESIQMFLNRICHYLHAVEELQSPSLPY